MCGEWGLGGGGGCGVGGCEVERVYAYHHVTMLDASLYRLFNPLLLKMKQAHQTKPQPYVIWYW